MAKVEITGFQCACLDSAYKEKEGERGKRGVVKRSVCA